MNERHRSGERAPRGRTTTGKAPIVSRDNPRFRQLLSLHHAKGINRLGAALVPGARLTAEVAARDPALCRVQVVDDTSDQALPGIPCIRLSRALFREVDVWGTGPPLLLVEAPQLPQWNRIDWPPGCTVVAPLQDPRNLGAALRCAAAFGAGTVILPAQAAHPYHPEAIRPSAGVQGLLTLFRGPAVGDGGWMPRPLLVLHRQGIPLHALSWPPAFGLLVGTEGPGVPLNLADVTYAAIPMADDVDSLNATAALAVALYAWSTKEGGH
ncbi:hypothetical protein JXA88_02860 [Candidatus Fermentibacteria bacterium]|nr:hypothetical protein [Candidatus Fermentibacteria bacterium]